jgi:hypothetical protein
MMNRDSAPARGVLAEAALRILARDGRPTDGEWCTSVAYRGGVPIRIRCIGPDLPTRVPAEIASHELIARERRWTGAYRLVITAPLIVFDLNWNANEPLRIMSFSRGDWERGLLALAE